MNQKKKVSGGERGIRTPDTRKGIHAFEARAFSHSAISPRREISELFYQGSLFLPERRGPRGAAVVVDLPATGLGPDHSASLITLTSAFGNCFRGLRLTKMAASFLFAPFLHASKL